MLKLILCYAQKLLFSLGSTCFVEVFASNNLPFEIYLQVGFTVEIKK